MHYLMHNVSVEQFKVKESESKAVPAQWQRFQDLSDILITLMEANPELVKKPDEVLQRRLQLVVFNDPRVFKFMVEHNDYGHSLFTPENLAAAIDKKLNVRPFLNKIKTYAEYRDKKVSQIFHMGDALNAALNLNNISLAVDLVINFDADPKPLLNPDNLAALIGKNVRVDLFLMKLKEEGKLEKDFNINTADKNGNSVLLAAMHLPRLDVALNLINNFGAVMMPLKLTVNQIYIAAHLDPLLAK